MREVPCLPDGRRFQKPSNHYSSTETFAALSLEEVIAYVRNRQPSVEIIELKVLGKVQVLSSSEHLE